MRHDDDRLSAGEVAAVGGLGIGAGLLAGFALSEWVGGVSRGRVRRAARRLREAAPAAAHHRGLGPAGRRRPSRPSPG